MTTTLRDLQRQYEDGYSLSAKSFASDVRTWIHGLTSHEGVLAFCVRSELGGEVTYRTVTEDAATILFSVDLLRNEVGPDQLPWRTTPIDDRSGALDTISTYLEANDPKTIDLEDASLQMLYNIAFLALDHFDDDRPTRVRRAIGLLLALNEHVSLPGVFEEEQYILTQELEDVNASISRWNQTLTAFMGTRLPVLANDPMLGVLIEKCPIPGCNKPIMVGGSSDGACFEGHALAARCGITFLPLFEPISLKRCYDCGRSFMNEHTHPLCVHPSKNGSLLSSLIRNFTRCPYCHGRFYARHGLA